MQQLPRIQTCAWSLVGFLIAIAPPVFAVEIQATNTALALQIGNAAPIHSARPISQASHQVYRIQARNEGTIKSGSAFLVSGRRVVATNHHVVDHAKSYTLGFFDARVGVRRIELQMLAIYPQKDLALMEAQEDLPGDALPLAVDYPDLGSDLVAIGFPEAADFRFGSVASEADQNFFQPSVVRGTVSRVMTGPWLTNQIQHQAPISLGYSGGPLIDNAGVVVGVSSAVNRDVSGIAYGVAAADLASLLGACSLPIHEVMLSPTQSAPQALTSASEPFGQPSPADQAMLQRANALLAEGDVLRARYLFEHLAREKGLAAAYAGIMRCENPELRAESITLEQAAVRRAPEAISEIKERQPQSSSSRTTPPSCSRSFCALFSDGTGAPVLACQKP